MKQLRILLPVLLAAVLLCGCNLQNRRPSSEFIPVTEPTAATEPAETVPTDTTAPPATAPQEVVVRDIYSRHGEYIDGSGRRYTYSYDLPYIDSESTYAMGCNSEIDTRLRATVDAQLAAMERSQPLSVVSIDYETRLDGDVLTLYITQKGVTKDDDLFLVYTVDKTTGEQIPGATMIRLAGFADEASFLSAAAAAIGSAFEAEYGGSAYEIGYEDALDHTLRKDNYGLDMPMYFDKDGHLVILATLYDLARAPHTVPLTVAPEAEKQP